MADVRITDITTDVTTDTTYCITEITGSAAAAEAEALEELEGTRRLIASLSAQVCLLVVYARRCAY